MSIFKTLWNKLRSVFSGGDEQYVSILPKDDDIRVSKKHPAKADLKSPSTEFGKSTKKAVEASPVRPQKQQELPQKPSAKPLETPTQKTETSTKKPQTVLETSAKKEVKEEPKKIAPVEAKPIVQEVVQPIVEPVHSVEDVPAPELKGLPIPELPIDVPVPPLQMEEEPAKDVAPPIKEKPVVETPVAPPTVSKPAASENGTKRRFSPYEINDQTAQRLARLLVSEIKLYYANKAEDIPKENLYDSLKGPIDKSRQHYRERLGAEHAKMPNYFHEELVKALCEGDESRLGPNYEQ